jgi:hypothetical protein
VILAGKAYRSDLVEPLREMGCTVEIPMEGLTFGQQLRWLTNQLEMPVRDSGSDPRLLDVQRFYSILDRIEARVGGKRAFGESDGHMEWPRRGTYFVFEPGEERTTSGTGLRVVRVGAHALKAGSKSTLWGRLRTHRGRLGGSHPGGGTHRGSVFRLHVGKALISRYADRWPSSVTKTWAVGQSAPKEVREREHPLECAVSQHIAGMSVLWVPVDDEPGPESLRGYVERNAIALLSNYNHQDVPIDPPSTEWLGRWGASEGVQRSGLWNVNHVVDAHDPGFLDTLEELAALR